ncbi:hypothetical protein TorRG33x02_155740 [Trema orientale]|uniref:Uncharacterized protein n=1 Tax=Trema orientale TaxID=63057 RepID=A0A2P5ET00_TREOI|nr:hypothetical protein TorRG33x02_155740 [Trema orientale]
MEIVRTAVVVVVVVVVFGDEGTKNGQNISHWIGRLERLKGFFWFVVWWVFGYRESVEKILERKLWCFLFEKESLGKESKYKWQSLGGLI